jgi:hypothetical protein
MISSAEDMSHAAIAHLNGGRYADARLISPGGLAERHPPAATVLRGSRGAHFLRVSRLTRAGVHSLPLLAADVILTVGVLVWLPQRFEALLPVIARLVPDVGVLAGVVLAIVVIGGSIRIATLMSVVRQPGSAAHG